MIAWYVYMHVVCCYVVALLLVLMMCVHIYDANDDDEDALPLLCICW